MGSLFCCSFCTFFLVILSIAGSENNDRERLVVLYAFFLCLCERRTGKAMRPNEMML